jgi:hypothetical protein
MGDDNAVQSACARGVRAFHVASVRSARAIDHPHCPYATRTPPVQAAADYESLTREDLSFRRLAAMSPAAGPPAS